MSAPDRQQMGGAEPFPAGLWERSFLTRLQHTEVECLSPDIIGIAHDIALNGLRGRLQLPPVELCRAVPYQIVLSPTSIEGGLDLVFARDLEGDRIRSEAARVKAYRFTDGVANIEFPFKHPQAVELFSASRRIATFCGKFKIGLAADGTALAGAVQMPITLATGTTQHPTTP